MTAVHAHSPALAVLSSMATRHVLAELVAVFRDRTGQDVGVTAIGGVDAARRVRAGEPFDVVILASETMNALAVEGHVDATSRVGVAASRLALAVRAGAHKPDVVVEATLRDALIDARAIGYSTGPSGSHLERCLARWGVAASVAPRLVRAPPGVPVGELVARGDVEIGVQQLCELIHVPGIDVVERLADEAQLVTTFEGAVPVTARRSENASRLLRFLASPEHDAARRRHGMVTAS